MAFSWVKSVKLSPKSALWIVAAFMLAFTTISFAVLLSDVTRDDLVALHDGLDSSKFSDAEVGSFFEVSGSGVRGPLCAGAYTSKGPGLHPRERNVVVVNKLGTTLPILTTGLGDLFYAGTRPVAHSMTWQIEETSITPAALWSYTRNVLNAQGDCGRTIDARTKHIDVRICPVHRVWKDKTGQTLAFFFDTYAINGCPVDDDDCSKCPRFIQGQVWTELKLKLDLLEHGALVRTAELSEIVSTGQ
jgi:hypothetical protein